MYTKQEISKQREAFWTTFGKYMQPVMSADGMKVNWVNYKTGITGIGFRMNADAKQSTISIVISNNDDSIRHAHYERFEALKEILHTTMGEDWEWQCDASDEYGKHMSTISKELPGVNIHKNEDWPEMISFFKPRIIALDEFWSMAKYNFEQAF